MATSQETKNGRVAKVSRFGEVTNWEVRFPTNSYIISVQPELAAVAHDLLELCRQSPGATVGELKVRCKAAKVMLQNGKTLEEVKKSLSTEASSSASVSSVATAPLAEATGAEKKIPVQVPAPSPTASASLVATAPQPEAWWAETFFSIAKVIVQTSTW
jgi:hypothetical protein